jgi:hypothetical protein
MELTTTKERLHASEKFCDQLQDDNERLTMERDSLKAAQVELDKKREEMTNMAIES